MQSATLASTSATLLLLSPVAAPADETSMLGPPSSPSTPDISPINTNLPNLAWNTGVVGHQVFQVEWGISWQSVKGASSMSQVESQYRFGLSGKSEVFLSLPIYNTSGNQQGIGDPCVGMKVDVGTFHVPHGTAVLALIPSVTRRPEPRVSATRVPSISWRWQLTFRLAIVRRISLSASHPPAWWTRSKAIDTSNCTAEPVKRCQSTIRNPSSWNCRAAGRMRRSTEWWR